MTSPVFNAVVAMIMLSPAQATSNMVQNGDFSVFPLPQYVPRENANFTRVDSADTDMPEGYEYALKFMPSSKPFGVFEGKPFRPDQHEVKIDKGAHPAAMTPGTFEIAAWAKYSDDYDGEPIILHSRMEFTDDTHQGIWPYAGHRGHWPTRANEWQRVRTYFTTPVGKPLSAFRWHLGWPINSTQGALWVTGLSFRQIATSEVNMEGNMVEHGDFSIFPLPQYLPRPEVDSSFTRVNSTDTEMPEGYEHALKFMPSSGPYRFDEEGLFSRPSEYLLNIDAESYPSAMTPGLFEIAAWAKISEDYDGRPFMFHSNMYYTDGSHQSYWPYEQSSLAHWPTKANEWHRVSTYINVPIGKSIANFQWQLGYPLNSTQGSLWVTGLTFRQIEKRGVMNVLDWDINMVEHGDLSSFPLPQYKPGDNEGNLARVTSVEIDMPEGYEYALKFMPSSEPFSLSNDNQLLRPGQYRLQIDAEAYPAAMTPGTFELSAWAKYSNDYDGRPILLNAQMYFIDGSSRRYWPHATNEGHWPNKANEWQRVQSVFTTPIGKPLSHLVWQIGYPLNSTQGSLLVTGLSFRQIAQSEIDPADNIVEHGDFSVFPLPQHRRGNRDGNFTRVSSTDTDMPPGFQHALKFMPSSEPSILRSDGKRFRPGQYRLRIEAEAHPAAMTPGTFEIAAWAKYSDDYDGRPIILNSEMHFADGTHQSHWPRPGRSGQWPSRPNEWQRVQTYITTPLDKPLSHLIWQVGYPLNSTQGSLCVTGLTVRRIGPDTARLAQTTFGVEHDATTKSFVTITQSDVNTIDVYTGYNKDWAYATAVANAPTITSSDMLTFAVDHGGRIMIVTQTGNGCQYQIGTAAHGFSDPKPILGHMGDGQSVTLDECYDVAAFTMRHPFIVHGRAGESLQALRFHPSGIFVGNDTAHSIPIAPINGYVDSVTAPGVTKPQFAYVYNVVRDVSEGVGSSQYRSRCHVAVCDIADQALDCGSPAPEQMILRNNGPERCLDVSYDVEHDKLIVVTSQSNNKIDVYIGNPGSWSKLQDNRDMGKRYNANTFVGAAIGTRASEEFGAVVGNDPEFKIGWRKYAPRATSINVREFSDNPWFGDGKPEAIAKENVLLSSASEQSGPDDDGNTIKSSAMSTTTIAIGVVAGVAALLLVLLLAVKRSRPQGERPSFVWRFGSVRRPSRLSQADRVGVDEVVASKTRNASIALDYSVQISTV
eukprot:TRINITY_DN12602_c0_g3_i2.p1 TRINITY_DN12602_c0_g3~~TRINITY_DN12602_c0_g3_i2.p1  ORF type:complete len:1211 (+),score=199.32 TRINITY_DN12602_c0_g3_i2:245-3877(+)